MSDIGIRQINGNEMIETMYALDSYAFHPSPPLTNKENWRRWVETRHDSTCFALFEDGTPVSVAVATTMTQNVRAALYGVAGVWSVATAPAARRKGYCQRLMAMLLAASRDAGQSFSCLYPFRESFYEQLGYITFPAPHLARLIPEALLPLLKKDLDGQIKLTLISDDLDAYQDYMRHLRQRVHGMAIFDHVDVAIEKQYGLWQAQAIINGKLEGLMLYELQGKDGEEGSFHFCVHRLYHDTSQAKYLLLQWIARHTDQAESVVMMLPPFEQPEMWLSDIRVKTESYRAPMGRVIDIEKIGGMQVGLGNFTARISDPLCPWNEGVWRFESVDGLLKINRAEEAECELSIQAVSALVYGAHDIGDFACRGWGTISPELLETMQMMFPPKLPYIDEIF